MTLGAGVPAPTAGGRGRPSSTTTRRSRMHIHRTGRAAAGCPVVRDVQPFAGRRRSSAGYLAARHRRRPGVEPRAASRSATGCGQSDRRWRVPWLRGLRKVPRRRGLAEADDGAAPPTRPAASAGSSSAGRSDGPAAALRWWQRLVATRLLEVDADGRLLLGDAGAVDVPAAGEVVAAARAAASGGIHQGDRFGEPQDVHAHRQGPERFVKRCSGGRGCGRRPAATSYRVREVEWAGRDRGARGRFPLDAPRQRGGVRLRGLGRRPSTRPGR